MQCNRARSRAAPNAAPHPSSAIDRRAVRSRAPRSPATSRSWWSCAS